MDGEHAGIQIIGRDVKLVAIGELIRRVARSTVLVLITGEEGTGKALIAQAIHRSSARADKPFVAVHCAASPEPLLARELLGYEPRAAPGVRRWSGAFERARGGTLFLEEVGSLPPALQTALLRVLQARAIERAGGGPPIPVEARVLAATCTDLQALVHAGRFRAELYYRLRGSPIEVPPLRARKGDIPLLVQHFLARYTRPSPRGAPGLSPAAMAALQAYDWPGNVQELERLIHRLVAHTPRARIQWQDLPWELHAARAGDTRPPRQAEPPFGPAALRRWLARRPCN